MVAGGVWLGRAVPFEQQWPLFEALRTTAAIIFAVIGAWIAIIYPERLKLSFAENKSPEVKIDNGLGKLFSPIVHSSAILCLVLLIGIIAPVLQSIPALEVYRVQCRGISYGILVALTLWQLWTVVLTLIPADIIKTYSDEEDRRKLFVNERTKRSN
ncbi:hypothetical protein G7000_05465 [Pseudomonas stutzeri]|nr:hypothetical protein [Stutzerimonas stutzeri]